MTMRLSPLEPEDLDLLYTIENDPALWSVGTANVPYSRYALRDYISGQQCDIYADRQVRLVVRIADGAAPGKEVAIGLVDLVDFHPEHRRAEIGFALLREYREKGHGRQAIRLLLEYASTILHLHSVHAIVPHDNTASLALLRTEGFTDGVTLTDWLLRPDGWHDALLLQKVFK